MSSLEGCIRKAGKALTKEDAKAIRAIRDDLVAKGVKDTDIDVNQQAVDEYLDILEFERENIMRQVEAAGGYLANPNLSPSEFSVQAGKNLEDATRTFPRKGIYRPEAETEVIDYKTGKEVPGVAARTAAIVNARGKEAKSDKFRDPNLTFDILTERTEKTVEMLYPDFYTLNPRQVLNIVATFDMQAALGIAKKFNLVPANARTLTNMRMKEGYQDMEFYDWSAKVIADWITKNETLPLYYKVEDVLERDMVEANPDNPMSATIKYAQVVAEAETAPPLGIQKARNWLRDTLGIKGSLGAVPQTKLKDFVRWGMESVEQYTATVKRMDAWMNEEMEGHHLLATNWLNFNKDNKDGAKMLGEFMSASTLTGVDVDSFAMPDAATFKKMNKEKRALWQMRKENYARLAPFWEKLGKMGKQVTYQPAVYNPKSETVAAEGESKKVSEAQMIYLSVRDTYMAHRSMLIHNLEKRIMQTEADQAAKAALIAKLRKQFEAGHISPYFPLSRFGKYQAVAKTKDGEVVAFIKRENSRERNEWMRDMRKEGFVVTPFDEKHSDLEQMGSIDPDFVAMVTGLLDDTSIKHKDPVTGEETSIPGTSVQDDIWQAYLRLLPDMSARKHFIHRKGRLGFTHDALRSYADHMFHGTHQMAKLRYGYLLGEHLKNAEEEAVIVLQRSAGIRNMLDLEWRPPGFEDSSIHEVMWDTTLGGPRYRTLYARNKKKMDEKAASDAAVKTMLAESDHDGPWAVPMANALKRRHAYNMNPKSAPWSTKMTAFGFLWFLSTSPAAGVLNLTQTAISAYPILRAKFSGMGSGMELLKASKDFATQPWMGLDKQGVHRMTAKLQNDKGKDGKQLKDIGERAAMEEFWNIGIFSKTRTRELMGLSEGGSAYSPKVEKYMEWAGYIFHKTEEMNRAVTALAAYRLARKKLAGEKGLSVESQHIQAIEMAEEMVEMSHYDYTNTNRPRFMQGDMGRVVFLFRNYSLNMQYRLIRDFRDGIWRNENIPIEERREARSRFLGIIGMTTIFAGMAGWPLMWGVEAIANNLLGDDDDPFDSKTEMRKLVFDATSEHIGEVWGQKIASAVMKGPWSAFTGADLSQRASLNNLWVREIPENLKDDKQGLLLHLMGELAGPIAGIGFNYAAGFDDIQRGHPDRAIEKFTPKFVGDVFKTIRYATSGAQTYQRDMVVSPEEMTSMDLFLQSAGFTPTRLADRYEQNRSIKDMEQKLRNRRSDLMNRLFMAWRVGDRSDARDIMKDIMEWNKANPRYPITPDGIMQSARTRAQYDMRTVGGVAVDKRLQYLQEQQRFTARPQR